MSWNDGAEPDPLQSRGYPGISNEDDLLVFGYGCNVYRDDEKAKWIEEGKHLIPCMGDTECGVTIDRYDGRGALMDLRSHEAPPGGANYTVGLSPQQLEIERLCEIERYRDYDENSEYDDNAYQEEEYKRLQRAVDGMSGGDGREYGSVGYSYNDNPVEMGPEPRKISGEAPYVVPADLAIPANIMLPTTMKSHAIIEKTAKFIAGHGTQMEIILKTKQANNPQFNFLSHGDQLNPYYKYLVEAIKTNVYKPPDESQYAEESDSANESSDEDGGYLHPSLLAPKAPSKPAIADLLSKANFKPSSNCAYSMLVSKLKVESDKDQEKQQASAGTPVDPNEAAMPSPQDQMIIDKMAAYVVKNGTDFETMARTRGDPRFAFLHPQHRYNWYFVQCKSKCQVQKEAVVASKSFVSYIVPTPAVQPASAVPADQFSTSIPNAPPTVLKTPATQSAAFKNAVKAINDMVQSQSNGHSVPRAGLSLPATTNTSTTEDVSSPKEIDEEEEKRLKEERRKKAALFLQKVRKSQFLQSQAAKSKIAPKIAELATESDDDLQVVACTASIADRVGSEVSSKVAILPAKDLQKRLNPFRFSYKTTALPVKEESQIPSSYLKEGKIRSSSSRRSKSPTSRRRSHSSSSSSSSSESSKSSSPGRSRRKKAKRRKRSKKRHKLRDRSRSRSSSASPRSSRSKKSKKRRR